MGLFRYGAAVAAIRVDDYFLGHLRAVVVMKMRRSEGFLVTGEGDDGNPLSVWIHPAIPMAFEFESTLKVLLDPPTLNRMVKATYHAAGLTVEALTLDELDLATLVSERPAAQGGQLTSAVSLDPDPARDALT